MKMILLGAPGAGKGTQAEVIREKLGIPPVSTGNIIREAMKNGTTAGLAAKQYVDSGGLVPDEIVIEMLRERLAGDDCKNGYILDGFPRTLPQAEALDKMGIAIDLALSIEITDEEIEKRLCGRRVCDQCNASYHLTDKPSAKGELCESCDSKLIIRKDDSPQTVRERLRVYHEQTEPLKGYYREAGRLRSVNSCEKVEDTTRQVLAVLGF